ncbi:conserved hypothetical protein [Pseudomonas chlororaphis]
MRPHSLSQAEHEQQKITIGLGCLGRLDDPWQRAMRITLRRAENFHAWLLPGSHSQGCNCQGSY